MTKLKSPNTPLTKARQGVFLRELELHGIVSWASAAASPHAVGDKHGSGTFYALRNRDPGFAEEWDRAVQLANDKLIVEARRRAIEGVPKLRTFKDQLIKITDPETGEERPLEDREYSDRLMELLLKGGHPDRFVERRIVESIHHKAPGGWTITKDDIAALSDHQAEQLMAIIASVRRTRLELTHQPGEVIDAEVIEVAEVVEVPLHPWDED